MNVQDERESTPLHLAVEIEAENIIKLLLQNNSNVNILGEDNRTPLHLLCLNSEDKFADIAKLLIQDGADINIQDKFGETPLHLTSDQGNAEMIQVILNERNVSTTLKNRKGQTAFEVAMAQNQKKIIRMIYEKMVESGSSNQRNDCVVCFKPRKGIFTFLPCGHAKTCEKCSSKILENSKTCPMCRGTVAKYQKIYH